jgi:hypothetical protein
VDDPAAMVSEQDENKGHAQASGGDREGVGVVPVSTAKTIRSLGLRSPTRCHSSESKARTTERTDKKGGTVAQAIRRVVSADGKTMNVTVKGKNAQDLPFFS